MDADGPFVGTIQSESYEAVNRSVLLLVGFAFAALAVGRRKFNTQLREFI
jgi:hypothetical protein